MKKIYLIIGVFLSILLLNSCSYTVKCYSYDELNYLMFHNAKSKGSVGDCGDGSIYFEINNRLDFLTQFDQSNKVEDHYFVNNNGYWYRIDVTDEMAQISSMCTHIENGPTFSFPKYQSGIKDGNVISYDSMEMKIDSFTSLKDFYKGFDKATINDDEIIIKETDSLGIKYTVILTDTTDGVKINFVLNR